MDKVKPRRQGVHRDLKPANILVSVEGEAKLLDQDRAQLLRQPPARRRG